jgi:hypothetical protein
VSDRLFDLTSYAPAVEESEARLVPGTRTGCISEHLAIVELLKRGHKVAVPVVDDEGIDLVVDYRTTVQVKSANNPQRSGQGNAWVFSLGGVKWKANGAKNYRRPLEAQVHMFHAVTADAWWIVPTQWLLEAGLGESTMGISLTLNPGRSKYASLSRTCRDAWDLLKQDWAA